MTRTVLWVLAGAVLGGIIHLLVILSLPALANQSLWSGIATLGATNRVVVLPVPGPGEANPLGLDPELTYAACQIDLRKGPGFVRGTLPVAFWSVAVYGPAGTTLYSTTNRDGIGATLDLGIFNAAQTRLLAQQQLDIAQGLLIAEAREDDVMAVVRLAPAHQAVRARYEAALAKLSCGNLPS